MIRTPHTIVLLAAGFLLHGCASSGAVSRSEMNRTITVQYGRVLEVEEVQLESQAGSNAVLGGILGAVVAGRGNRLAGAAVGAVAGGALTAAAEGDNKAFSYTIELASGATVKVITEQGNVETGHCVSFEQGSHTNVRQVSDTMCDGGPVHPEVHEEHSDAAEACHAAKEELLAAETSEEIDAAIRKVKALCDH